MIELHVVSGLNAAASLGRIKMAAADHPGEHELTLVVRTAEQLLRGQEGRRLTLGDPWRYAASRACMSALEEFGRVEVHG